MSTRPRDIAGRPVPAGSPDAVAPVAATPLPPQAALAGAEGLLAAGRPFAAHEVLEAAWKAAPAADRDRWQGLAQIAVGLTHAQRGNAVGAARVLRRGADRLTAYDVPDLVAAALGWADRIDRDGAAALAEVFEEGRSLRLR